MTSVRLQRIEEIFHSARELDGVTRHKFVRETCGADEELRNEVEALLAAHESAADFIDNPPTRLAAELLARQPIESMTGRSIGHYQLLEKIGSGGMGEVYLARDDRSDRKAAVKILPAHFAGDASRFRRFEQEARAVVALNHPNILTVYEVGNEDGTQYIASELIEGETLRQRLEGGPMPLDEVVDLALQVAGALAAAHKAGIVHRDIKPENIMLRPDGYAKVLDFGVAKLAEQELQASMPKDEALLLVQTTFSSILGTLRYMSPEQARGEPVDARADIWSLGVVLYEMVTGSSPFSGAQPKKVIASILTTEPSAIKRSRPEAPTEIQKILDQALKKDREVRYPTIKDMAEALRKLRRSLEARSSSRRPMLVTSLALIGAAVLIGLFFLGRVLTSRTQSGAVTGAAAAKSIAVLPFENLSRDKENAYFAEGIQDEILTRLSKIADLKVTSRASTQHYKSAPENLAEVARQLGVAHILEGSVQKSGDTVRVNVQLINATNDFHLWADTFDRKVSEIFSVETDVAKTIAEQLRAHLTGQEEQIITAKPTDSPEAYDAYLRGLAYSQKPLIAPANAPSGQKYLKEAVRLDPKFALAWALLSYVDAGGYITRSLQPTPALREEARQAAESALALQPQLGEAVLAKGFYHYCCLKDYDTAEHYYEMARRSLPNGSRIPELLALLTRRRGQWDRSESYFNEAERLDPRNVSLLTEHAVSYTNLRRFPEALKKFDQVLDITPDDPNTLALKAAATQAEGDLPTAASLLAPLRPAASDRIVMETQVYQAILERQTAAIIPRLQEILAKPDPAIDNRNAEIRFWLGWAEKVAGDDSAARENWRQARGELEYFLKEQPENDNLIGYLALTNMGLGDKAAAFQLVERDMAALPVEKDAFAGPNAIEVLARVAAQSGEPDRAIAALQKVLSIPYLGPLVAGGLTPALLRLDPMFDPLRNDPRFQNLLVPDKSIAVLPFENLSADKQNDYFASGIQDEILTKLTALNGLKVISRASTEKYRSHPAETSKVAAELGVATLLEGSVQKAGDSARINLQLIDAKTDSHLWAQTFDREMMNIFSVEAEVAAQVAKALKLKLIPQTSAQLALPSTNDPEAHDLELRAFYVHDQWFRGTGDIDEAFSYLRKAIARDPNFAVAYARLSIYEAQKASEALGLDAQLSQDARRNAEKASALRSDLPLSRMAMGLVYLHFDRNYIAAAKEFQYFDHGITIPMAIAQGRLGRWGDAVRTMEQAVQLDPRNAHTRAALSDYYGKAHRYAEAIAEAETGIALDPNNWTCTVGKVQMLLLQGELDPARELLRHIPTQVHNNLSFEAAPLLRWRCEFLGRNYREALRFAEQLPNIADSVWAGEREVALGRTQMALGNPSEAQRAFVSARQILVGLVQTHPDLQEAQERLVRVNALCGEQRATQDAITKLSALTARQHNAERDLTSLETIAEAQTVLGQPDQAIPLLSQLLKSEGAGLLLTPALLKLDPVWDPLRSDPRFQALVSAQSANHK